MAPRLTVLLALCAAPALAEVELPNYDAFLSTQSSRAFDVKALSAPVRERVLTGRVASVESRLGVPSFFWAARDGHGLRGLKVTPEQAARRYLFTYAELYRLQPAQLAESRLATLHDLGSGAIVASFQRDEQGTRVFNDELKVVMNQDLELIALTGYVTPARKVLGDFQLGSEQAIDFGFQQLAGAPLGGSSLTRLPNDEAGFERFTLGNQPTPVRVRRVFYPMPNGLEPAWHVELEYSPDGTTGSDLYTFVVSARDGRLMFRKNLTQRDFNYRVWADATGLKAPFDGPNGNDPTPHPQATNNNYNPPFVAPNLVTLDHGPISTNDPWLAATATTTDGNNATAYADFNAPNGFTQGTDLTATTTSAATFDRVYDVTQSPNVSADQRRAAVTQLFYDVNFFHDWYYDVGFDEKAGNAQKNNLGRGGAGNDPVLAEGEDYSGTNNANMSTPSDGASPRMQMYVFTAGSAASVQVGSTSYRAGVADFGPQSFSLSGTLQLVSDGDVSNGSTNTDGCNLTWATPVTGKIAVIDRGQCTFAQKVENAQANGAIGAIILNNAGGGAIPLSGSSATAMIPSLSMGRNDGTTLKMTLAGTTPVTATLNRTATVNRDGTLDNGIIAHEWGHYISNRLIGDGNGISNNQGGGMGEGWGDFHALLLTVKGEDALVPSNANYNGTYAMAGYTTYLTDRNGFYWGIRRLPYSTNLLKNPLTFKHIQENVALPANVPVAFGQSGRGNSEVHSTGEVWATMLWECYAALLRDSGRLTFEQARDRMRAYLVAAYKITPVVPTFVDARDAVLAAAVAQDPTDFALFSAAFAKRGLGMLAVAPDKDSQNNSGVIESFVTGNAFEVVKVELDDSVGGCDRDGHLDVGETGKLTVTIKNVGVGVLASATGTVRSSTAGVAIAGGGQLTFASVSPFQTATATVQVSLGTVPGNAAATFAIDLTEPTLATPGPVHVDAQFRVNYDAKPSGSSLDDVEAPMTVWRFSNDPGGVTGSDFRRYEDTGTSHWFFGPDPEAPADTYLTSPALDVGQGPFSFSFSHRYQFEGDATEYFDGGVVEISIDGGRTWVDLGSKLSQPYTGKIGAQSNNPLRNRSVYSGESANYPAWSTVTVDLGTAYAGKSVLVRFRIGSDDALGLKGWEIDDLQFVGLNNRPFPTVVSDPNLCSNRAPVVTAPSTLTVNEGTQVKLTVVASDPDGEPTSLSFVQVAGPIVTMTGDSFTAPEVLADTELQFEITASDGRAVSAAVTQKVLVRDVNKTPVVEVTPAEQTLDERSPVQLSATATDGDGDAIAGYRWVQRSGPAVALDGASTSTLSFTAPEVGTDTVLTFEVVASDGKSEGAPTVAHVTVHNVHSEPMPIGPAAPQGCGCSESSSATTWLAAAMAVFLVFARRKQR
ncbi:MAG: myxosortase-dependent M36 family metallopeptidase [Archangiaceae bacterium]|nr:myxosortase-dependent M36 family metallopeptidase [Archangiaceae bacterium]